MIFFFHKIDRVEVRHRFDVGVRWTISHWDVYSCESQKSQVHLTGQCVAYQCLAAWLEQASHHGRRRLLAVRTNKVKR